jgi:3-methylcrotonyl-CoA carboxylase alpha subunit
VLKRVLIANRGEIARRVIRTARRMAVETVAVYSDADASSPFVAEADQAVRLGSAPAAESYLNVERVLSAARSSGADSIHPGYGFLSENADFAEAVKGSGLIWVGPPASAIRAMGLKDEAKRLMAAAGVPTTPGYQGVDQSELRLRQEADRIGYPVLIKAVAGGGGKGMRRVNSPNEFSAALASCRLEAAASFGDDRVLLETYVPCPRHIEVQVFGDAFGNVIHLFERDCSLQRRHQKVIEEAPAPGMDGDVRESICAAAVRAAAAVGYEGAGTIEFIADASHGLRADRIWFMEMNTRLQVEHPVTEAITGQDLVEWQLRVASGERIPRLQHELGIQGAAIEARLYAENPKAGFLPSTGRLERFRIPGQSRVDSAVDEGNEITPFYDPMIAKLIVHASTREQAARELANVCRSTQVWPIHTNAALLARCLSDPDFISGQVNTDFIGSRTETLIASKGPSATALTAAALFKIDLAEGAEPGPWKALSGFRVNAPRNLEVSLICDGKPYTVNLDGQFKRSSDSVLLFDDMIVAFEGGEAFSFSSTESFADQFDEEDGDSTIRAPMAGRIVQVDVTVGDRVKKGQALVTLEAMKLVHTLVAPTDALVAELHVAVDLQVSEGAILIRLEE